MPVEIKKLIVKAVVEAPESERKAGQEPGAAQPDTYDQEALVKACVKQVLQILKQSKKR